MRIDEVLAALRNADAAGDTEAAKHLAQLAKNFYQEQEPEEEPTPKTEPKSGFLPSLEATTEELKGGLGALAGKLGLMDTQKAEDYYKAQQEKSKAIFKPTEEGWTEAPVTKFKELLGGSIPYMAAPFVAGASALALPEAAAAAPFIGGALEGLGLGTVGEATAAGLAGTAGATQFTATNLARQMDEGKSLADTNLGTAALASVPQAALDVFGLKMIPGIKNIFSEAGMALTNAEAKKIADQGLAKTLGDYALTAGKVAGAEGLTEAGQQVFERLQAGLSITDPDARKEYLDNFLGGAVLGGVLSVPGRMHERGQAKAQAAQAAQAAQVPEETTTPPTGGVSQLALPAPEQRLALPAPTGPAAPAPAELPTKITETNVAPPTRLANEPTPNVQHLVDQHDTMQRQAKQLQTQIAEAVKARDTGAIAQLTDQHQKLQDRIGALQTSIQQLGGVTQPKGEFETQAAADLKAKQSKVAATEKKLDTATEEGDFDAVAKHAAALEKHKQELADLQAEHDRQRAAYAEQEANVTQRGQNRELFTPEEAPPSPAEKPEGQETPNLHGLARTPAEAQAITQTLPARQETINQNIKLAEAKLAKANKELPAIAKSGNQQAIYAKTDEINKLEDEIKRLLSMNRPNRQLTDIFSNTNLMRNAINEGDTQRVLDLAKPIDETQRQERGLQRDQEQAAKDRLIASLDARLNLAGQKLVRKASPALKAELETHKDYLKNGTHPNKLYQELFDKQGEDAFEYEYVKDKIDALRKKVENRQGNNKKSYLEQIQDLATEYEDLERRLETGIARPTLRDKAQALQNKLNKGETKTELKTEPTTDLQKTLGAIAQGKETPTVTTQVPVERQMDASERYQTRRRMQTIQKQYDHIVNTYVAPVRKQIEEIHSQLYSTEAAAKASDIEAAQRAENLRRSQERTKAGKALEEKRKTLPKEEFKEELEKFEGKAVPMSRAAKTAQRINAGDVVNEARQSTELTELAKQKGEESPAYQAMVDEQIKRLDKLRKQYGPNDKAVNEYRIAIGEERVAKAQELGMKTPEYKKALAEKVEKLKAAIEATGKQEIKSKRTPQETRKSSGAPGQLKTSSEESKAETAKRTQRYNRLKGIKTDFEEAINSEKEGEQFARGVETQTPDLTETQVKHLENNDIQAALNDLANAKGTSKIARVVAARLAALLDKTDVKLVNSMTDKNGNEVLGSAISSRVTLSRNGGLSEEILLHEGTHAGAERVIVQYEKDPSKLTEMQRVAVKELMLLHNVIKNDPRFTSVNAKSSLSEFVAEVMSNKNLQEQLKGKRWKLQDAWNGFKSIILRMLGFDQEAQTMLGAALQSVDALFIPSSTKLGGKETAVNQRLSAKDIAALHTGSNSMKQFADQFGGEIKQKDRTPEDANRIGLDYLDDMYEDMLSRTDNGKYIKFADPNKLDYSTVMSDGKNYDPDNALHYVEAEPATFANLKAQKDETLRQNEARSINSERRKSLRSLIKNMMEHGGYTYVEQALVAKAAAKYAILSGKDGRLKLATIEPNNRHSVAVVGVDDAHAVIEELRAGKPLKEAFLDGMQKVADKNAKNNQRKEGWQKFAQSDEYDAAVELNAGAANTPWCTGAGVSTAQSQIQNGDFYIYYSNGRAEVAIRMNGKDKIGEIRGNSPNQALNDEQQKIAKDFLAKNSFANTDKYVDEFDRKQFLIGILKGDKTLNTPTLFSMGDYLRDTSDKGLAVYDYAVERLLAFRVVDGYSNRPDPSAKVVKEITNIIEDATEKAFASNYFPGQNMTFSHSSPDVFEFEFKGKTYSIDAKTVKGLNHVTIYETYTEDTFPQLEIIKGISNFKNVLKFPSLTNPVDEIIFFKNSTIYTPVGAVINKIRPASQSIDATVYGVQTVKDLDLTYDSRIVLNLKLPDALYVNAKQYDAKDMASSVAGTIRAMLRQKARSGLVATAEMFNPLTSALKDAGFKRLVDSVKKQFENAFGKQFVYDVDRAMTDNDSFSDWVETATNKLYAKPNLAPKELLEINKKINKEFFNTPETEDRALFTAYGTVEAPNKIADAPPVQAMTEEPEEERYAPKAQAPGFEKVLETADKVIASPKSIRQRVESNLGLAFRTQVLDRLAPLEKIAAGMEDSLKGMQMMYYLRMYDQRMSFTQQAVGVGVPQRVTKKRADGKVEHLIESVPGANLARVVSILKKAPNMNAEAANRLFSMYLLGKRAERVGYAKLNYKVNESALRDAVKQIEGNKELKAVFDEARGEYNEYNKNLMKFLADSGALSAEDAKALADTNDYIPYYRERNGNAELMIGAETPIKVGNLRDQPYLHELIGGEDKILDFLTSSVQNTSMLVDMGLRNLATKNAVYELIGMKLAHTLGKATSGPDIVRFRDKGVEKYAVINTETLGIPSDLLVKGMAGIPLNNSAVVKVMSMPATFLRKAVTISPVYAFRQLVRDSVAAPILSGANFTPILGAVKELGKSTTKTALERRGIIGGQIFTGTNEDLSKILRDIQAGKTGWTQLLSKAEAMTMEADAATRRAQYNSYIAQGLSEMEATLMSLEAMNFNRRGVSPSVSLASKMIPFFNAQLQSLDVLYRAFTGKMPMNERLQIQSKLMQRGAMLAMTAVAYTLLMQDDDTYKNANPDEKYGNFFVHVPGLDEALRVPVPFEIGYIFKGIPEALINTMSNEHGGEEAYKAFKSIALQTIPGGTSMFLPQAVKPLVENVTNYSFFTGRPLESKKEQMLEPGFRFRDNTSEIAKDIGQTFNVSPIKIENLVRGYTGTVGTALMQALSLGAPTSGSPEQAVKRLSDAAVIGAAFQPKDAGGRISALYDDLTDIKTVNQTFKTLLSEGRRAEAMSYLQENSNKIAMASIEGNVSQQMATITKAEMAIKASNLSPQEKRDRLDQMRQLKIKIATSMKGVFDKTLRPAALA